MTPEEERLAKAKAGGKDGFRGGDAHVAGATETGTGSTYPTRQDGGRSRRRKVRKSKGKSLRRKKMTMKQRQQQQRQQRQQRRRR